MQEAESRSEFEAELRQQLAQQAAAHSDHLVDALRAQRVRLEAEFEKRLIVGLQAERERMIEEISAVINRVDAVEAAVDGQLCSAVIWRCFPLAFIRHYLSYDDCPEDMRGNYQNCAVLCTTVMHNDTHTHMSRFLNKSVGLG